MRAVGRQLAAYAGFAFVMVLAAMTAGAGPKWDLDDKGDSWMQLSVLIQPHYRYMDDAADQEDFYLRRGRIILAGQVTDGVKFFVETDNDKAGMNGAGSVSTDIQDAFADVRICGDHWLQAGLILLPFSFENRSSAGSLLGIDYNSEAIKMVNDFVWRDYGAELHGNCGSRFAYRVGAFDGYDPYKDAKLSVAKNDDADLRFAGHLAFNLIGTVETNWFFTNAKLTGEEFVSVGAGFDTQGKATITTATDPVTGDPSPSEVSDSDAVVLDMESGFAILDDLRLLANAAYFEWDNAVFDGNTAFVESGLLYRKVMVTGKYSLTDPSGADTANDYTAGLHYFMKGHNARAGLEYTAGDTESTDGRVLMGLQLLL